MITIPLFYLFSRHYRLLFINTRVRVLLCVFVLFAWFCSPPANSQSDRENARKLTSTLQKHPDFSTIGLFLVQVTNTAQFQDALGQKSSIIEIIGIYSPTNTVIVESSWSDILKHVVPLTVVKFVDIYHSSVEPESSVPGTHPAANKVNLLRARYPTLSGEGIGISIKDQHFDTTDIDLAGRWVLTGRESATSDTHANDMATMAAGGGNSASGSQGVAWKSRIASSDFNQLFPDSYDYFDQYRLSAQNHSYGVGVENNYTLISQAYDVQVADHPALVHVFSAGNRSAESDSVGLYQDVAGYANLTGSFKTAKNVLTVGAVDETLTPSPVVSRGPTNDGRLKPEVVAYSTQGSSEAAALVSGVAAVMQQAYRAAHADSLPSAALLRAILFNTAEDVGSAGIDFVSGYGNVNAYRAVQALEEQHYWAGTVSQDQSATFTLNVPEGAQHLKLTLAWLDLATQPIAAQSNNTPLLINDLDMVLINAETNQQWLPWTLSAYPHADSLTAPPQRRVDRLNNQEQISLEAPSPGTYAVQITGHRVSEGLPSFYVAYQWDLVNSFRWTYPTGSDALPLDGEPESLIRWETTYAGFGVLDYSLDGGQTWSIMTEQADLARSYYRWARPDTLATALLRMKIGNEAYVSDTFLISPPPTLQIGFACADSVLLTWPALPQAEAYIIYRMGSAYLEPIATIADTLLVLPTPQLTSPYYAVAAQYKGFTSHRSSTIDYTNQGLDCYFFAQYAELSEQGARVTLALGTTYQVDSVVLEKQEGSVFYPLQTITPISTTILLEDTATVQGPNIYRTRLIFANGQSATTPPDTVVAPGTQPFLVYPNPVAAQQYIRILPQSDVDAEGTLTLFTSTGQPVLKSTLQFELTEVLVPALPSGIYLYQLTAGEHIQTGKIVIY